MNPPSDLPITLKRYGPGNVCMLSNNSSGGCSYMAIVLLCKVCISLPDVSRQRTWHFVSHRPPGSVPARQRASQCQEFLEEPVTYTNFARVSVTPEELILDLALNSERTPDMNKPIRTSNRVVMNFYTETIVERLAECRPGT